MFWNGYSLGDAVCTKSNSFLIYNEIVFMFYCIITFKKRHTEALRGDDKNEESIEDI